MHITLHWIGRGLLLAAAILLIQVNPVSAQEATPLTKTDVSFTGGQGTTLHGTIIEPRQPSSDKKPAMVMLSGSGAGLRTKYMKEAEQFAERGMVVLVYDKRTEGYSQTNRNYDLLAEDAIAAITKLKTQANIDETRIGIWGVSEGAWVAPIAATKSSEVDFVVAIGAVGVESSQQQQWSNNEALRHQGIRDSSLYLADKPGFQFMINAQLYPLPYFSSIPHWEKIKQPVLALWGNEDQEHVTVESATRIRDALNKAGNNHYVIDFLPNGQDQMHITRDGGFDNLTEPTPGYIEKVSTWVASVGPNMPISTSYGTPPMQERMSKPIPPYPAYASWPLQLLAFGLFFVAFVIYPLIATTQRIVTRRQLLTPLHTPVRWLASLASVAVVGALTYTIMIFSTAGMFGQLVIGGRSFIWLLLQVVTLGALASLAFAIVKWYKLSTNALSRAHRIRFSIQIGAGVVFILWALYWGLLFF